MAHHHRLCMDGIKCGAKIGKGNENKSVWMCVSQEEYYIHPSSHSPWVSIVIFFILSSLLSPFHSHSLCPLVFAHSSTIQSSFSPLFDPSSSHYFLALRILIFMKMDNNSHKFTNPKDLLLIHSYSLTLFSSVLFLCFLLLLPTCISFLRFFLPVILHGAWVNM